MNLIEILIAPMKENLKMPNWCYTDFTVSGPAEDITRFREAVRGTEDGVETRSILIG
jgi:hypothetical protein